MMKVRKGETVELEIGGMAFGGQGIARVNGYVVFVRGGVPGDRLTARIYRKKKDYAEAKVVELIDPSPIACKPLVRIAAIAGDASGSI